MICNDGQGLFEATSRLAQFLRCLLLTSFLYTRQSVRARSRRQIRIIKSRRNNKTMFEGISGTEGSLVIASTRLRKPGSPRDLEIIESGTQEACWLSSSRYTILARLLLKPESDACSSRSCSKCGKLGSFARCIVKQAFSGIYGGACEAPN